MKRLLVVLLVPVVAQFAVHGVRMFAKTVADASVSHWNDELTAAVEKDFPRE
jgi:hypothetical protein